VHLDLPAQIGLAPGRCRTHFLPQASLKWTTRTVNPAYTWNVQLRALGWEGWLPIQRLATDSLSCEQILTLSTFENFLPVHNKVSVYPRAVNTYSFKSWQGS
jgi:hypothetical protein